MSVSERPFLVDGRHEILLHKDSGRPRLLGGVSSQRIPNGWALTMSVRTLSDLIFRIREISSGRPDLLSIGSESRREVLSTADFLRGIHSLALAFENRGLTRGDRVAIFSENRPEWHIVDFACQLLGVQSVPVPPGLASQQVGFILRNSACRWVFCDNREKVELLRDLMSTLNSPPKIGVLDSEAAASSEVTLTRLMGEGAAKQGDVPIERFRGLVEESDPASLTYTKSSSGDPERQLLSHRDLIAQALKRGELLASTSPDRAVSGLPLAQGFQRTLDHSCFYRGVSVHYLSSNDELQACLARERPSMLTATSKVYEKLYQQTQQFVQLESPLRRWLFRWAIDSDELHRPATRGGGGFKPLLAKQRATASRLILRRVYQRLGGRLRLAICGGPPLGNDVRRFFATMGLAVFQYDTSERQAIVSSASELTP